MEGQEGATAVYKIIFGIAERAKGDSKGCRLYRGKRNNYFQRDLLRQIADTVCRMAVIYGEDEDINWSGLRFFDEKSWSFVPHGMYLYDGIGGVAVFWRWH